MSGRFVTLREVLLKAGFNPEQGTIILQWDVYWLKKDHTPTCPNKDDDDWCDCPKPNRIYKRTVKWSSSLLNTPTRSMEGAGTYGIIQEDRIPEERHRTIDLDVMAWDDKAVYSLQSYDGDQWIQALPKDPTTVLIGNKEFKDYYHSTWLKDRE